MKLKAVVFDLWGTLVLDNASMAEPRNRLRARLCADALTAAGHSFSEDRLFQAIGSFAAEHGNLHLTGFDYTPPERLERILELLDPALHGCLSPDTLDALDDALTCVVRLHPPRPMPASHGVLREALDRGLHTALISNTGIATGQALRHVLRELGLLALLRVQTYSDEARHAKPAPEIFRCTLEALDVAPQEAVMIGDLPRTDIAGARAVGMWAVQIGDARADGVEPHARIEGLSELLPALARLGLLS